MTRKDYIAIAAAIASTRASYSPTWHANLFRALNDVSNELARTLQRDNARFDEQRFLRAAGSHIVNRTQRIMISKAISTLEAMRDEIGTMLEVERDAIEMKSDAWRDSDAGQAREEKCSELENGVNALDEIIDNFNNAIAED